MKKIVVLGPESTGKSTLVLNLSNHYKASYVKEYARDYLESGSDQYKEKDLLQIAKGQMQLEDKAEHECNKKNTSIIFYDTDLTVIKIWSEFKYGKCDTWILEEYERRKFDLYLLTFPDLDWSPDPLREHPSENDRLRIFDLFKKDLISRNVDFRVIEGRGENRTGIAIKIVDSLLK